MIPKVLHQVWLGQNPLPDEYVAYRETWMKHHPDWEFRLWTEDNLPANLLRQEVRERLRMPAERADMLRLEVIHDSGGVYMDTDIECLRPIDALIAGVECFVADSKPGHANNAVIGAIAGHPFIARALRECQPRQYQGYDKAAAGPLLIDRLVKEHPEVKVFEPWVFYPSDPEERSRAYAVHHVARSWKDADGFRRAALTAEKRLTVLQDELWRVMQEVKSITELEDLDQVHTRLASLSATYVYPPRSGKSDDADPEQEARQELKTIRLIRSVEAVERNLTRLEGLDKLMDTTQGSSAKLDRLASEVMTLTHAMQQLTSRLGGGSGATPPDNGASGASRLPIKDRGRPVRDAAGARGEMKSSQPAARNDKALARAKTEKATHGKAVNAKAPAAKKPVGLAAAFERVRHKAGKRLRKFSRRAWRSVGRLQNMCYRPTYATRLDRVRDRDEFPVALNRRKLLGVGVEIGVKTGGYSDLMLRVWKGKRLISVDPWMEDAPDNYVDRANVPQSQQEAFCQTTVRRLSVHGDRSVVWRKTSAEAAKDVADHSLDFVYIDARHDYESVLEDLNLWYDKVRPGGIVAGHDYVDGVFEQGVFGVKRAVDEFFGRCQLRVYSTDGKYPVELFPTWLVEKPHEATVRAGGVERGQAYDRKAAEAS